MKASRLTINGKEIPGLVSCEIQPDFGALLPKFSAAALQLKAEKEHADLIKKHWKEFWGSPKGKAAFEMVQNKWMACFHERHFNGEVKETDQWVKRHPKKSSREYKT